MVCQRWRMLFIHDEIATNARHWQTHTLRAALMLCGCVLARVRGEVWTVLRRNRSSFLSGPSPYCERASPLWTKKQWAEWVLCFISVSSPLRGVGKISWTVISHTTIFLLCDQTVFIKGKYPCASYEILSGRLSFFGRTILGFYRGLESSSLLIHYKTQNIRITSTIKVNICPCSYSLHTCTGPLCVPLCGPKE